MARVSRGQVSERFQLAASQSVGISLDIFIAIDEAGSEGKEELFDAKPHRSFRGGKYSRGQDARAALRCDAIRVTSGRDWLSAYRV